MALCAALLIEHLSTSPYAERVRRLFLWTIRVFSFISLCIFPVGIYYRAPIHLVLWGGVFMLGIVWLVYVYAPKLSDLRELTAVVSLSTVLSFCLFIVLGAFHANQVKSTQAILRYFTQNVRDLNPAVKVIDERTYSHFFYGRSWEGELTKPVRVTYIDPQKISPQNTKNIIVRDNQLAEIPQHILADFQEMGREGKWIWFQRRATSARKLRGIKRKINDELGTIWEGDLDPGDRHMPAPI